MIQSILIATDGSEAAHAAERYGVGLAARLKARGRESQAEIGRRLTREGMFDPDAVVMPDVVVINDGPLYAAVAQFLAALRG